MNKGMVALTLALLSTALTASDGLAAEATLGRFPLCEASGALLVDCPDGSGQCLLVGDNEQGKALYLFPVRGDQLDPNGQSEFKLKLKDDNEIKDIEALAGGSDKEILVFASHSRNSTCESKGKRRQFGKLNWPKETTDVVDNLRSKEVTCKNLFANQDLDATMKAVCKAIDEADAKATKIEDDLKIAKEDEEAARNRCNAAPAYNAEGAVVIHSPKGKEVWIGLRSPLVPQPGKKPLAIMLHLKNLNAYSFDRAVLLDLDGRGVRDLSSDAGSVWLIAGPPEDKSEPFQLRRFPVSALGGTKVIEPDLVDKDLPDSSEGLAISGKTAYVVIDGDAGKGKEPCKVPAQYKIVPLP